MKVAKIKPLTLKSQKSSPRPVMIEDRPYVDVLVRLPYLSFDEVFTYFLPEKCESAEVGHLVAVTFGGHATDGLIVRRFAEKPDQVPLKAISKVISEVRIYSDQQMSLAQELAKRYVSSSWSFLSSISPPYSKLGLNKFEKMEDCARDDQSRASVALPSVVNRRLMQKVQLRDLVILPSLEPSYPVIAAMAILRATVGKVIVVLPDTKDIQALSNSLEAQNAVFSILTSHQSKSERFAQYLSANTSESGIYLSLRSGVFLHLNQNDTLIIVNEVEPHHYESHSPTWNSRDVALTRSKNSSILFISRSPSVEIVRQVELGWIQKYIFPQPPMRRMKFSADDVSNDGSRQIITKGLAKGHVLVSVARSGYINGIVCRKCRNTAECECGGRLQITRAGTSPCCVLCGKKYVTWSCSWCKSQEMYAIARGAQRTAAEFGRAFPGFTVVSSSADQQIRDLGNTHTLVVATPGSEPIAQYAAIVILDAERAYGQIELRSQEEVRSHWFTLFSLIDEKAEIFLSLSSSLPIAQGLMKLAAYDLALREMHERDRVQLPPFTRLLSLEGSFSDLTVVKNLLKERGVDTFGLDSGRNGKSRLLIKIPVQRNDEILELFASLTRIKIVKKEEPFSYRFDPFAIG